MENVTSTVIIIGNSFLYINFKTADEWKNFYLVSSAVVLYDLLEDEIDQQILACFVRACSIFVSKF